MKHLLSAPHLHRFLYLPTNIRLGWKSSSLLRTFINYGRKKFFLTLVTDYLVIQYFDDSLKLRSDDQKSVINGVLEIY